MTVPVVQAVVLADYVQRDHLSGKITIVGTYNEVSTSSYPTALIANAFGTSGFLYINFRDIRKDLVFTIRVVHLESDEVIVEGSPPTPIKSTDPLVSTEVIVPLPQIPIPRPGAYVIEVVVGDVPVGQVRVNAVETKEAS